MPRCAAGWASRTRSATARSASRGGVRRRAGRAGRARRLRRRRARLARRGRRGAAQPLRAGAGRSPPEDAAYATVAAIALHGVRLAEAGARRRRRGGRARAGRPARARAASRPPAAWRSASTPTQRRVELAREAGFFATTDAGGARGRVPRGSPSGRGADAVLVAAASVEPRAAGDRDGRRARARRRLRRRRRRRSSRRARRCSRRSSGSSSRAPTARAATTRLRAGRASTIPPATCAGPRGATSRRSCG